MLALKELLSGIVNSIQTTPEKKLRSRLIQEWPTVAGSKIAAHTKPQISLKGELTVWVDQPALAQEMGLHKSALLKRAKAALGEKAVKSVRIFVGQIR